MPLLADENVEPRNRRKEDNGWPWWVAATYKIGIPSAIAIYLIYSLTTQVQDNLTLHSESVNQANRDVMKSNERLMRVLQQICINSAKSNQDRNNCVP